jgi:hypothetical protein
MVTDTSAASGFPRVVTARDAASLTQSWLDGLLPVPKEIHLDLVPFLLQLCAQRIAFNTVLRRAPLPASPSLLGKLWRAWRATYRLDDWERHLNTVLLAPWRTALAGQAVVVIIDEHLIPYWGKITDQNRGEVRRSLAQGGTTYFYAYATAAVLWRGIRIQVAITRVREGESHAAVVSRLILRVQRLGPRVLAWVLDKGFFSTGVVAALRPLKQPYLIAAPRRGEKTGIAALLTQLEEKYGFQEEPPPDLIQEYTLSAMDKTIPDQATTVIIGWEPVKPEPKSQRQRTVNESKVKEGQKWRAIAWIGAGRNWTAKKARRMYAPRTGFESGYRLSKGCRGRTTSRDPAWRLFLFAVSLLLQNAWIWLITEGKQMLHRRWKRMRKRLPFIDVCAWIAHVMELRVGYRWHVDLPGV